MVGEASVKGTSSKVTVENPAGKKKKKNDSKKENKKDNKKDDKKEDAKKEEQPADAEEELVIEEDGEYTTKEEVAAYIHEFGKLPSNYITKRDAQDLGWDNKLGNLDKVAPGKSIGGDKFGNYEELLPTEKGRKYFECDIDFDGGYRGAKRIIFSNDGLIYYTEDHYKSFEQLYDKDGKVENENA
ncbi:MAG: ribonuclease [Clostridiales bacterium]|nr:ribonuclease [Candidatus Blautia equi]